MKSKRFGGAAEVLRAGAKGAAVGYALAPLTTELYLHRTLAHNTYSLSKTTKAACWFISRSMGFNPTAWALKHRIHHSPLDSQEPTSRVKALATAVRSGFGTRRHAEAIVADPNTHRHVQFRGQDATDPILEKNDKGELTLKYQNKVDEALSRHPLLEKGTPLLTLVGVALYRGATKNESLGMAAAKSAAAVAGCIAGNFAPGLIAAAYPERRDGYQTPTEAGRNMGKLGEVVFGGYALHASHHANPHLSEPPEASDFNRDRVYDLTLQLVGMGEPKDGNPANEILV